MIPDSSHTINDSVPDSSRIHSESLPKIKTEYYINEGKNLNIIILEYDEKLCFFHYYTIFRKFDSGLEWKSFEGFPFLANHEFLFNSNSPIECDKSMNFNEMGNKEALQTVVSRIKTFSKSHDENYKKTFLENLVKYCQSIGVENTSYLLMPVVAKIVDDNTNIKLRFLQILQDLIDYLKTQGESGYVVIKNNLLNILYELYHPQTFEIVVDEMKQLLFDNFVRISHCLNREDRGNLILTKLLSFANDDCDQSLRVENRSLAARMVKELSADFGAEYCELYIVPQMVSLADDQSFLVRKEVAQALPALCEVISHEYIEKKIQPLLVTLSQDLLWNVRKVCVEILPQLMKLNKEKSHFRAKNLIFIHLYEELTIDNQKYVRLAALEKFGEFISNLDKDELSQNLLDFYKNSIEEYFFNVKEFGLESDILGYNKLVYSCVYNFPAVLYCYGSDAWPQLKKTFCNLSQEQNIEVRKSLISSFHEICAIIGTDLMESELLGIYESFLESNEEEVRSYAIRNLPKVLRLASKEIKEKYLKYFRTFSLDAVNDTQKLKKMYFPSWKNKIEVCESILCYFDLYEEDLIHFKMLPLVILFCLDDVYHVRKKCSKVLATIVLYLYYNSVNKKNCMIALIKAFAYSKSFSCRIVFVKMCKKFLVNQAFYNEVIVDIFHDLVKDPILGVRIAMSKLCASVLRQKVPERNYLITDNEFNCICYFLSRYPKLCVSDHLKDYHFIETKFEESEETSHSASNDMSFLKTEFNIDLPASMKHLTKDPSAAADDVKQISNSSSSLISDSDLISKEEEISNLLNKNK